MPTIIPQRYLRVIHHPVVILSFAVLLVIVLPCYLFFYRWQPERQMVHEWESFRQALERRNWSQVRGTLADDFEDQWGNDRETAVEAGSEVLRGFLSVNLEESGRSISLDGDTAVVSTRLIIRGKSTNFVSEAAKNRANKLLSPWVFHWKKQSGLPWDWKVTRISNDDLKLDASDLRHLQEYRD